MATYNVGNRGEFWAARYDDRATMNGTYNITQDFDISGSGFILIDDPDNPGETILHNYPSWVALGNYTWPGAEGGSDDEYSLFTGTINGNGYTISNLTITYEAWDGYAGLMVGALVGYLGSDSTAGYINDLTLENVDLHGELELAAFVSIFVKGTIDNCHAKNVTVSCDGNNLLWWIGGIVGYNDTSNISTINNCSVDGFYCEPGYSVGGIAGDYSGNYIYGTYVNFTYNRVYNMIVSEDYGNGETSYDDIGGLIGDCSRGAPRYCSADISVLAYNSSYSASSIGGLCGSWRDGYNSTNYYARDNYCEIDFTLNTTGTKDNIGGCFGRISNGGRSWRVYSYGNISLGGSGGNTDIGGYAGYINHRNVGFSRDDMVFNNIFSVVDIGVDSGGSEETNIGGFIGYIQTRTNYLERLPYIYSCASWTGNWPTGSAISKVENRKYYASYQTGIEYTNGTIVEVSYEGYTYYQATNTFTSTNIADDVTNGDMVGVTPTVLFYEYNINLADTGTTYIHTGAVSGNHGWDEDDAESLAHGTHEVYYFYILGVKYWYWSVYPENPLLTPDTATWFEYWWSPTGNIYPVFDYPGEYSGSSSSSWQMPVPEPINFWSNPTDQPIEFYER